MDRHGTTREGHGSDVLSDDATPERSCSGIQDRVGGGPALSGRQQHRFQAAPCAPGRTGSGLSAHHRLRVPQCLPSLHSCPPWRRRSVPAWRRRWTTTYRKPWDSSRRPSPGSTATSSACWISRAGHDAIGYGGAHRLRMPEAPTTALQSRLSPAVSTVPPGQDVTRQGHAVRGAWAYGERPQSSWKRAGLWHDSCFLCA